jgi:dihydropteroate synthase
LNTDTAVARALELAGQGAEILDIGGESTRPGATPVNEKEELRRVVPVIEKLAATFKANKRRPAISIDTMKPAVACAALEAGASIINDVAASRNDDEMWKIVSKFRAGYILMHSPRGFHEKISPGHGIVREVCAFFSDRLEKMRAAGVGRERIILDAGIGFGKDLEQNLQLIAHLGRFARLRRPLLLGVSRKSFIKKLFGANVNERLPASLACAILGIEAGAHIIRAHDVAETLQAIRMAETILETQKRRPRSLTTLDGRAGHP